MSRLKHHPWPTRLTHILHIVSMIALVVTGLVIGRSVGWLQLDGLMGELRYVHFVAMYVLTVTFFARIYWAFFGRDADFREFLPQSENRGKFLAILRYYQFLKREHPVTAKYNPLQKMTYILWGVLLVIQGLTGFALYWPDVPLFAWLSPLLGGLMVIRIIHSAVMWAFLVTVAIHVYLVFVEDFANLRTMFIGGGSPKRQTQTG